jgi:hypothetical protein
MACYINNYIYFTIICLYTQVNVNYRKHIVLCIWNFEGHTVLVRVHNVPYKVLCGLEIAELTYVGPTP